MDEKELDEEELSEAFDANNAFSTDSGTKIVAPGSSSKFLNSDAGILNDGRAVGAAIEEDDEVAVAVVDDVKLLDVSEAEDSPRTIC